MKAEFGEIRSLYNVTDNSFGLPASDVTECEARLSIQLPRILKEYYLQLGNHEGLNQAQDTLLLPSQLYFDHYDNLIFYQENQAVSIWGIKRPDLILDNPPVYISFDNETWVLEDSLSTFLTSVAYLQALFAFPYNANAINITTKEEQLVRKNWRNTGISLKIWNAEFFQNDLNEVLAFIKSEKQLDLFVATKTKKRLRAIDLKLTIEWEYCSLDD